MTVSPPSCLTESVRLLVCLLLHPSIYLFHRLSVGHSLSIYQPLSVSLLPVNLFSYLNDVGFAKVTAKRSPAVVEIYRNNAAEKDVHHNFPLSPPLGNLLGNLVCRPCELKWFSYGNGSNDRKIQFRPGTLLRIIVIC